MTSTAIIMRSWRVLLPNAISAARLAIVPVLWVLALQGRMVPLGIGLAAAGVTDVVDGYLARRWNTVSASGARLDSMADNVLVLSGIAWLMMLRQDVVQALFWPLYGWLVLYFAFLLVGWFRFRRFGNLHLWSGKVSAFLCYIFLIHCLVLPGVPYAVFYITMTASVVSLVEGIVYMLTRDEVRPDARSIFLS